MPRQDIYARVTETILATLELGEIPWRKPWAAGGGTPQNLVSRRPYRGMNTFLLAMRPHTSPYWLTYRQAQELGGYVRKGEHGTAIIFWSVLEHVIERDDDKEIERYGYLKTWNLFNLEQCAGIEAPETAPSAFSPIEAAERVIEAMPQRPAIHHGGDRAFYSPFPDTVQMPTPAQFASPDHYYNTIFHELGHSTGHASRLARPDLLAFDSFGGHAYSREELVAEMTAAMLCGVTGIAPALVENSAAYIQSWLKRLADDKKLVVQAAALAQKAADFILGTAPLPVTVEAGETSMDAVAGEA